MFPSSRNVFWSVIVVFLILRSVNTHVRTCRSDYNDLGSKTLRASIVFEGEAKHRIKSQAQPPDVHQIEFKVLRVLKGKLNPNKTQNVLIEHFGQPDVDRCVAPDVTLDSHYLVFVDRPSGSSGVKHQRTSGGRNASVKNSGSVVFQLSSFPEASSQKAVREVRNYACDKCGRAPKITKESKNKTEQSGQKVRLHCRASGKPQPQITWYKDGVLLNKDKRISFKDNRRDSRLQIRNTVESDSGIYRCKASNILSSSFSRDIGVLITSTSAPTRRSATAKPHSEPCPEQSFCLNGGTCYEMTRLKKQYCECAKNYVGLRCEEKLGRNNQGGKRLYLIRKKRKRHLHPYRL